jgi:hypothetical protein
MNWRVLCPVKTELIHMMRRKMAHGTGQILVSGQIIKLADTAKLQGITSDKQIRWKEPRTESC